MPKAMQLHIPTPCHENWNAMSPKEQGRFCGSCQKTVVDFSMMTDKEIVDYFSKATHQVCGRFSGTQLNKDLQLTEKKRRLSFAYLWNFLLATFLVTEASCQEAMTGKVQVQTVEQYPKPTRLMGDTIIAESPDVIAKREIKGTVTDEHSGLPVPGVTIMIKGTGTGTLTDSLGNFHLSVEKKDFVTLIFSSVGYKTQTRVLNDQTNWQAMKVALPKIDIDDVLVVGEVVTAHTKPKRKKIKKQ